jgi:outer membrane protein
LAGVKVTVEQTKGLLAANKELMAFYLGIPADKIKLRETQKFPTALDLENYLRSVGSRPDILAQVEQERMAMRQLSAAKGALWPTVTGNGTYNLTTYPQQSQEWYGSLEISLPLFDGGLIIDKISQQKALTRQSELNVDNLRRTADQGVRTALANFESSAAQYVALKEQVEMSALNYNAQADDYKSGIVTNLDVLTALSTLETARQQWVDADINTRLNLILLHVAAGMAPTSLSAAAVPPGKTPVTPANK